MELNLTQNKTALVDLKDFYKINVYKWHYHHTGYAVRNSKTINGKRKIIFLHREILKVSNGMYTDHINKNKLDNRRSNLRLATYCENNCNKFLQKNSTTGYKGVSKRKYCNKWRAYITKNKKRIWLGSYNNPQDAALAYNQAAVSLHGKFAYLNKINS